MANHLIETFDLTKVYNLKGKDQSITALNRVNISINEGEIFGLLGPNGAGKTTFIQILTTLMQPTSGYAIIDGYNILEKPKHAKLKTGLMLDSSMLYNRITGYDNLKFFCKLYMIPNYREKITNITKEFELEKWLNQYVEKYSSGMKMKLALCRTLLLDRKILFLDEPTLGLDVKTISFIVKKLKQINKTIILTSHDMNVVDKLCNRIAFINKGNIIKMGTQKDIRELIQTEIKIELEIVKDKEKLKRELDQQNFIIDLNDMENGILLSLRSRNNYKDLFFILVKYNIQRIREIDLSLEELFLRII